MAIALNALVGVTYFLGWGAMGHSPLPHNMHKAITNLFAYLCWGLGFSQVFHIVPLVIWLRQQRYMSVMRGVIAGAALFGLLGGACFVIIFPGMHTYVIRR
ncbi:MAG: hypothetical protein HC780_01865 [Leptolyngbyaceae cyanobacterium CSU_1_3]|nr:hypothetical protein [Leptolyngbyaceae cyanobacterium CSU_1_3]